MKFMLHLMFSDHLSIRQVFGPYDSESIAEEVRNRLMKWPALPSCQPDNWRIVPATQTTGSPGQDVSTDPNGWTPETAAGVRARFAAGEACQHCKGLHARACPRVKAMSFHPSGALSTIEFWPDGKWPDTHVIWPEEVPFQEEVIRQ